MGGYSGLHGVEMPQAQEGNADEVPCKAAKQDAKATPSSSDDMENVPLEGDRAQPCSPGAAPTKRQPAKRVHSAVDEDSSEHSADADR